MRMDSNNAPEVYSTDDELYQTFGRGFVSALHGGLQIATREREFRPARELVDELKDYVEKERAREQQ